MTLFRRRWHEEGYDWKDTAVPFEIWAHPESEDGPNRRGVFFLEETLALHPNKCGNSAGRYVRIVPPSASFTPPFPGVDVGANPSLEVFDFVIPRGGDMGETFERPASDLDYPNGTLLRADYVGLPPSPPSPSTRGGRAIEPGHTLNPRWDDFRIDRGGGGVNMQARFARRELELNVALKPVTEVSIDGERIVLVDVSVFLWLLYSVECDTCGGD